MATSYMRSFVTGIVITLLVSGKAIALTVFDVIQLSDKNYSDDSIVNLINATNSSFELKATDIPRLMELGVSETVIQTMLKSVHKENVINSKHVINDAAYKKDHSNDRSGVLIAPAQTIAGGSLEFELYKETGSGHHQHSAVNLAGVRLLVLRDEGSFSSIVARAGAVVNRLKLAASKSGGVFHPKSVGGSESVVFYANNMTNPILVLNVFESDANAYQKRSGRVVSPLLLSAYWSDLLSDYWSIAVNKVNPSRLLDIHQGEALVALQEQWETSRKKSSARLTDAVQLLPNQDQEHLLRLATSVPHDFKINQNHLVKQP